MELRCFKAKMVPHLIESSQWLKKYICEAVCESQEKKPKIRHIPGTKIFERILKLPPIHGR